MCVQRRQAGAGCDIIGYCRVLKGARRARFSSAAFFVQSFLPHLTQELPACRLRPPRIPIPAFPLCQCTPHNKTQAKEATKHSAATHPLGLDSALATSSAGSGALSPLSSSAGGGASGGGESSPPGRVSGVLTSTLPSGLPTSTSSGASGPAETTTIGASPVAVGPSGVSSVSVLCALGGMVKVCGALGAVISVEGPAETMTMLLGAPPAMGTVRVLWPPGGMV